MFRSILQTDDFETNCLDCEGPSDSRCLCKQKRQQCSQVDDATTETSTTSTTTPATFPSTTTTSTQRSTVTVTQSQPWQSQSQTSVRTAETQFPTQGTPVRGTSGVPVSRASMVDSSQTSSASDASTMVSITLAFFENSESENMDEPNIALIAGSAAAALVCCLFLTAVCATIVLMYKKRNQYNGLRPQTVDYNSFPTATMSAAPTMANLNSTAPTNCPQYTTVSPVVNHYEQPTSPLD